ncbi:MAG: SMP-30/gluconolactonase/LRE family protein, partial [Alphaproteobacteria bacterium]|nr:SMP-30/gluconolactonase/LRE family protein [Alphaproteobacteria bacterium]
KLRRACGEAVVTNGPALSGDGRWLYYADSGARTIWKYRIESDGMPASGVEFLRLSEADGYPDGIIVDAEDCLWVALWDGWGVRRYSAEGKLLMHVPLPCARVTKVALGGADLRTAYVTTARIGLSANECMQQPLAGSLFAFEAPAPGRPLPQVRLA